MIVSRQPNSTCHVALLSQYFTLRGFGPGAISLSEDGLPVSRSFFSNQLLRACHLCGLDPSRYKGHSFRIGAASYAADQGFSDTRIMLGRWKSSAFCMSMSLYVRVPSLVCSWTHSWGHHNCEQGGSVCMGGCPTLLCLPLLLPVFLVTKDSSRKFYQLLIFSIISVVIITGKVGQFAWAVAPPCCVLWY